MFQFRRFSLLAGYGLGSSQVAVLPGEMILQASVPELIDRADCTEDASFAGVVEESHEAHRCMPAPGELGKGE